MELGLKVQE